MIGNWFKYVNLRKPEISQQFRQLWGDSQHDILLALIIVSLTLLAFMAGRVSVLYFEIPKQAPTITALSQDGIINNTNRGEDTAVSQEGSIQKAALFVASKNGKKYHLPECPGAKQIAEKNKIFFSSREEAEATGYQPAANCPGLSEN